MEHYSEHEKNVVKCSVMQDLWIFTLNTFLNLGNPHDALNVESLCDIWGTMCNVSIQQLENMVAKIVGKCLKQKVI